MRVDRGRPAFLVTRVAAFASAVLLSACALLLSGCARPAQDTAPLAEPATSLPTGNVQIPAGVTLTRAGTALEFGRPAVLAYQLGGDRGSVLSLSVDSAQAGRLADLGAYQLPADVVGSRPYYVRYTVRNLGSGDLSGVPVPLYAVDPTDTLIRPSTFVTLGFPRCPSTPLPAAFAAGKVVQGCAVYFLPNRGSLVAMSYRPLQAFAPITWKGAVSPSAARVARP